VGERPTGKHALVHMKMLGTPEALWWTLFHMSDMLVGQVLGDACVTNGMVEDVTWVCKSSSGRDSQVDLGHVLLIPLTEPLAQVLLDLAILMGVP
jgi:hypothetical protein